MALSLLTRTDRTFSDPKLVMEASRLLVDYDCEEDDGRITTGRVVFEEPLAFQYWDGSCGPAHNVLPPTEVRVLRQSDYLGMVTRRWSATVGGGEWQEDQGGAARFHHFTIYWDDAGSLDVVAARCQVVR